MRQNTNNFGWNFGWVSWTPWVPTEPEPPTLGS